jgi:hypothetical protein
MVKQDKLDWWAGLNLLSKKSASCK